MKLTDLEPHWLTPDVFIFRSPVGHGDWLTCPRVQMNRKEQHELFEKTMGDMVVVGWNPNCVWNYLGDDFTTMTVTPSIDASASGNWHGNITSGMCVGGGCA